MIYEYYNIDGFVFYDTDAFVWYYSDDDGFLNKVIVSEYFLTPIDWKDSQKFRRIWRTNNLVSLTGVETRSSYIADYLDALTYTYTTMNTKETNLLHRKLYKNIHNYWAVPYWMDELQLTAQGNPDDVSVAVASTLYCNFRVGGQCALIAEDGFAYEVMTITNVSGNSIGFSEALQYTWPIGSSITPLLKGKIQPTQVLNVEGYAGFFQFELLESVDVYMEKTVPSISFPTYLGKDIFNIKPNFKDKNPFTYNRTYNTLLFYGVVLSQSHRNESFIEFSRDFLFGSKAEIYTFLNFFDIQRGRYGSFWIPTYQSDIIIIETFLSTDITFSIEDIDWDNYWGENKNSGKFLNFFFSDGTEIQRRIISCVGGVLTLDSSLGKSGSAYEITKLKISFLYFGRFDMDQIEFSYVTNSVAELTAKFATIPEVVL